MIESLAHSFAFLRPTAAGYRSLAGVWIPYLSMHHPANASREALVSQGENDDLSVLQLIDAVPVCVPISSVCCFSPLFVL